MDALSELSGPTSVVVESDIGQPGRRSSTIFLSKGSPNIPGNLQGIDLPLEYDLAIDIDPESASYLFLHYYEKITIDPTLGIEQLVWVPKLRLIPNSISKNEDTTFTNGVAIINLQLPIPPGFQGDIQDSLFIQHNVANRISESTSVQDPISSFFAVTALSISGGAANMQLTISAMQYSSDIWIPLQGQKTVHLVITVV